ncbi:MAG: hypothetical protein EOO73_04470 [Myxococcales bacterium]|nr:MAG: hypothetical protein EOO73_04470 [Myxococcales bacterium]
MKPRALLVASVLAWGCGRDSRSVVKEAEFGVFFGGQVQELKELEKELDPARQRHGVRLVFDGPLPRDIKVTWELSLPVPERGGPRSARVGDVTAKAGEASLDVPLSFRPEDPLGLWHAKVTADGAAVVDRDFTVVAAAPPPKVAPKPLPPRGPSSAR